MKLGGLTLAFLTLVVSAQPQNQLELTKTFILGFFSSFQGTTYSLMDTCLSTSTQTQLSSDFIDIIHGEDIATSAIRLEKDIKQAAEDCMLWVITESVSNALENRALETMVETVAEFEGVWTDLTHGIEAFPEDLWESGWYFGAALGRLLGEVTVEREEKAVLPPRKPNYLDGIQNFTSGVVHGLQTNTTGTSVCLGSYGTIITNVRTMGDVAYRCALLSMNSCNSLGIALENLLMVFVTFNENCRFGGLWEKMKELGSLDGWVSLYKNMYWYQTQIRQNYSNLLSAYSAKQYYKTGLSLGQIIQLSFSFTVK